MNTKSMQKPAASATASLMPRISASDRQCSGFAMSSGTASSDVARNTASRVPSVTTLLAYRFAAMAENPHWGSRPSTAPGTKPKRPPPASAFSMPSEWRCSTYSISQYAANRKGSIFTLSSSASSKSSKIKTGFSFSHSRRMPRRKIIPLPYYMLFARPLQEAPEGHPPGAGQMYHYFFVRSKELCHGAHLRGFLHYGMIFL